MTDFRWWWPTRCHLLIPRTARTEVRCFAFGALHELQVSRSNLGACKSPQPACCNALAKYVMSDAVAVNEKRKLATNNWLGHAKGGR